MSLELPARRSRPSWMPADWDSWDRDRREALIQRLHPNTPKPRLRYTPFTPTAKQTSFLLRRELEAFYGGAAGPGKSTALLMAALQYADVPGYSALILRRTYQELGLPGALIPKSHEWLDSTDAHWNGDTHTWTFPSGATLTFGYLQTAMDKFRYLSSEFQYIGFDELTSHREEDYRYLFSRLRKSIGGIASTDGTRLADVPLRMRGASNPGGPGHDWVEARFVDPETREPGAVFIPARLNENPYLDPDEYARTLSHLTSVERERLLRGDWAVMEEGTLFNTSLVTLVDDWAEPVAAVRYWDLAATEESEQNRDPDWTVGSKIELGTDGYLTITDVDRFRASPGKVKNRVSSLALVDGYHVQVYVEQDPGQAGKAQIEEYARTMQGVIVRAGLTRSMNKWDRATPVAAAFENRALRINAALPNLRDVMLELRRFDGKGTGHDDIVDTFSGGYWALTQGGVQTETSVSSVAAGTAAQRPGYAAGRMPDSVAGMMQQRRIR